MLGALQRYHRTQHRQPQEQDRGQLVAPNERVVEDEAADHARAKHANLYQHQQRGGDFHSVAQYGLHTSDQAAGGRPVVRIDHESVPHDRVMPCPAAATNANLPFNRLLTRLILLFSCA